MERSETEVAALSLMLDAKTITLYLAGLEKNGNSAGTRRLRLSCIKAFFAYASDMEPTAVIHAAEVSQIKVKATEMNQLIDYLSESAVKALLEQPDPMTRKGLRDRFFLLLLYDTGARLQEIRYAEFTGAVLVNADRHHVLPPVGAGG